MNMRTLVKYPFLPQALDVVRNIELDELLTSSIYENARDYGIAKVISCFDENLRSSITDEETKIIGFYISKLFLIALSDPIITRRFANVVRDELEGHLIEDSNENIYLVASSLGVKYKDIPEEIRRLHEENPKPWVAGTKYELFILVHFLDFIKYASGISGEAFKLIHQPLKEGWVPVSKEEFIKILREAFVKNFVRDIESNTNKKDALKKYFKDEIEKIRELKDAYISRYSSQDFGDVVEDAFPPCLKSILVKLKNGVNLPHQARFFLVTFLHKIGVRNEDIMKVFATAPDFNESMTRYQVEHITGGISKKEYEVPKCSTLQAYGLCVKNAVNDNLCKKDWMSHPLLYYKIKKEWISRQRKSSE